MDGLIFLMNKLQDTFRLVGSSTPITLPRIAVVGGQSAGKSSVLENFVGKCFLPSGSGIVTRRPLVLQLIYNQSEEYGEFDHKPGVKYHALKGVREEITNETNRLCGEKGVSPESINLRVFSPNVINLTLVDLPGLTKVASAGQDRNIVETIRKMVTNYITDENCLILAVTPATQDSTTSDAIALSMEIDPTGDRTIGVITKLDSNLNSYEQVVSTLKNDLVQLKRGFIGIINRNPEQLKEKLSREELKARERAQLQQLPQYSPVIERCGMIILQDYLQEQLVDHISRTLPTVKTHIEDQLRAIEMKLEGSELILDTADAKIMTLTRVITNFTEAVEADLGFQKEIVKEFEGKTIGAQIKDVLFNIYPKKMNNNLTAYKSKITDIVTNIEGTNGIFSDSSFSTPAFHKCVRDVIKSNRVIVTDMTLRIKSMLIDLIKLEAKKTIAFENLRREVISVCNSSIDGLYKKTHEHLMFIIESQESYIDTFNADNFRQMSGESPAMAADRTRVLKDQNKIIFSGDVILVKKAKIGASKKEAFAELNKERLDFYNNNKSNRELKMGYMLNNMVYKGIPDRNTIVIQTINNSGPAQEMMLSSEEALSNWAMALQAAGVKEVDANNSPTQSKPEDKNVEPVEPEEEEVEEERPSHIPIYLWATAKAIRLSVISYVKSANKTLHDISTKEICTGLPIMLRKHIGSVLSANLIQIMEEKDLMKQSDVDVEKIIKMKETRAALRTAIDIINDPSAVIAESRKHSRAGKSESISINGHQDTPSLSPHSADNHFSSSIISSSSESSLFPQSRVSSNNISASQSDLLGPAAAVANSFPNKPTNMPFPKPGGFRPLPPPGRGFPPRMPAPLSKPPGN